MGLETRDARQSSLILIQKQDRDLYALPTTLLLWFTALTLLYPLILYEIRGGLVGPEYDDRYICAIATLKRLTESNHTSTHAIQNATCR